MIWSWLCIEIYLFSILLAFFGILKTIERFSSSQSWDLACMTYRSLWSRRSCFHCLASSCCYVRTRSMRQLCKSIHACSLCARVSTIRGIPVSIILIEIYDLFLLKACLIVLQSSAIIMQLFMFEKWVQTFLLQEHFIIGPFLILYFHLVKVRVQLLAQFMEFLLSNLLLWVRLSEPGGLYEIGTRLSSIKFMWLERFSS